jgi:2-phosphoglycerate kinase
MANDTEVIDLNKLKERELLILVYKKVESLEKESAEQTNKQQMTDIQLAVIKTQMRMQVALIGFASGIASSLIVFLFIKALGGK